MLPAEGAHRVLVVEDDWSTRWLVANAFQKRGIEADVAESGREALTLLKHNGVKYCSVVLDLNVPPPNGIEIAQFIMQSLPDLPVIVLSGYPDLAERLKATGLGTVVKLILVKPVEGEVLVAQVHGFCGRKAVR
jgi:DNA-binding response OmpR family regulator